MAFSQEHIHAVNSPTPVANVVGQEEHQVSWHQAGTDFAVSEEHQVLQAVLRELSASWLEDPKSHLLGRGVARSDY